MPANSKPFGLSAGLPLFGEAITSSKQRRRRLAPGSIPMPCHNGCPRLIFKNALEESPAVFDFHQRQNEPGGFGIFVRAQVAVEMEVFMGGRRKTGVLVGAAEIAEEDSLPGQSAHIMKQGVSWHGQMPYLSRGGVEAYLRRTRGECILPQAATVGPRLVSQHPVR